MKLSNECCLDLFEKMLRIRRLQEKIEAQYLDNEMKTPIHLYIGQEAIAVGVCANLRPQDYINSNHRSHGHYIAKGGDMKALVAELFCRETGCSKGRGGSMHLIDTKVGHMGSSSIVGGGIPLGTGMALAIRMKKQDLVSVVFFSDGAADEGVVYESFNYAMLRKLPVIFVLENNQYSVCSKVLSRQGCENVYHRADQKLLLTRKIDGNDVKAVFEASQEAVARARGGEGPSFIECSTYRIRGHAGCESQDFKGYRPVEEVESWKNRCPVETFKNTLLQDGILDKPTLSDFEERIDRQILEAFEFARQSPLPLGNTLQNYLFCEDTNALV